MIVEIAKIPFFGTCTGVRVPLGNHTVPEKGRFEVRVFSDLGDLRLTKRLQFGQSLEVTEDTVTLSRVIYKKN